MTAITNGQYLNPLRAQKGMHMATQTRESEDGITVTRTHKIASVARWDETAGIFQPSSCRPECVHIDGECYDVRGRSIIVCDKPVRGKR